MTTTLGRWIWLFVTVALVGLVLAPAVGSAHPTGAGADAAPAPGPGMGQGWAGWMVGWMDDHMGPDAADWMAARMGGHARGMAGPGFMGDGHHGPHGAGYGPGC